MEKGIGVLIFYLTEKMRERERFGVNIAKY